MNFPRGRVVDFKFSKDPSSTRRVFIIYNEGENQISVPSEVNNIDLLLLRIQEHRSVLMCLLLYCGLQITWGMKC